MSKRISTTNSPKVSRPTRPVPPDEEEQPTRALWFSHISSLNSLQLRDVRYHGKYSKLHSSLYPGVIPDRMTTRLSFGQDATTAPGVNFAFKNWRANSLYDPDHTGVGHQPTGFDQWMAFYQKFLVTKARIHIVVAAVLSANHATNAYLWPDMAAASGLTSSTVLGKPALKIGQHTGPGCPALHLTSDWVDIAEFLGLTITELRANEDCFGTSSANPTTNVYFAALFQNADLVNNLNMSTLVRVEYETEFFDRVPLSSS